jgi:hypothetical protein
MVVWPCKF